MVVSYKHKNTCFSLSVLEIANINLRRKIFNSLLEFFQGFEKISNGKNTLEFIFTDNIDLFVVDQDFVRIKDIRVGSTLTHFHDNELNFLVSNTNPFKIIINVKDNETLLSSVRVFNKAFKTNIDLQVTTFYYRIFLLFSQLWNLENNCSYIHAASVERNNQAILFSADSGVGKSSLLLQLSLNKGYKFIADDLTILSKEGEVFFQGRSISIKPYHITLYNFLLDKLNMSCIQKLQWKIVRDNRLTFRIAPKKIFYDTSNGSKINRVIHLCNYTKKEFMIKDINSSELIKYTIPILTNELFLANNKLDKLASLPGSYFVSTNKIYTGSKEIFLNAFKKADIKLVFVPYKSSPVDLFNFLKKEGCLD